MLQVCGAPVSLHGAPPTPRQRSKEAVRRRHSRGAVSCQHALSAGCEVKLPGDTSIDICCQNNMCHSMLRGREESVSSCHQMKAKQAAGIAAAPADEHSHFSLFGTAQVRGCEAAGPGSPGTGMSCSPPAMLQLAARCAGVTCHTVMPMARRHGASNVESAADGVLTRVPQPSGSTAYHLYWQAPTCGALPSP
jgi:hypothetical protein